MKKVNIALLVLAGALAGALVMKVVQRPAQVPAQVAFRQGEADEPPVESVQPEPAIAAKQDLKPSAFPENKPPENKTEEQADALPADAALPEPSRPASPPPVRAHAPRSRPSHRIAPPVRVADTPRIAPHPSQAVQTAAAPVPDAPKPLDPPVLIQIPQSPPVTAEQPKETPPARMEPENAPVPAPTVPPPNQATLNAGMLIPVRLLDSLSSDRNHIGDFFAATLDRELVASGFVIAERGARVEGRVTAVNRLARTLSIELILVHTSDNQDVSIQTVRFDKQTEPDRGNSAMRIGGGAAVGAVIGGIAGGGKGAAIGAAAGGGIGAGDVMLTRRAATLPSETRITFRLRAPVTVTERM